MTIGEVSQAFEISVDTLRYYEKIGLIEPVPRKQNGIRNYDETSLNRIEFIICMRAAGLSIELLQKYFKLYKEGAGTIETRRNILLEQKNRLLIQMEKMQASLNRLNYKIDSYEKQLQTGQEQANNLNADEFITALAANID